MAAGDSIQLLEVDDGSGWIKVADRHGHKGLIPTTYIELSEGNNKPTTPDPEAIAKESGTYGQCY